MNSLDSCLRIFYAIKRCSFFKIFIALFLKGILFLLLLSWSRDATADWPLWSGGRVENFTNYNQQGRQLTPSQEYLKKIEVFHLKHNQQNRDWRLTFITGREFVVQWSPSNTGQWNYFCRNNLCDPQQEQCKSRRDCQWMVNTNYVQYLTGWVPIAGNPLPERCTPLAIPDMRNRYTTKENNWNNLPAQPNATITFTVTGATNSNTVGKITGLYGDFRKDEKKIINEFDQGYHNGVDIAAPAGTSIGFLVPPNSTTRQIKFMKITGANTRDESISTHHILKFDQQGTPILSPQFYYYGHIKTSDAIKEKDIYDQNVKLGEIGDQHYWKHVHFFIQEQIKFYPYVVPIINPLESMIDRVDPVPTEQVSPLSWSPAPTREEFITFKTDDNPRNTQEEKGTVQEKVGKPVVCKRIDIIAGGAEPIKTQQGAISKNFAGVREARYRILHVSRRTGDETSSIVVERALLGPNVFQTYLPSYYYFESRRNVKVSDVISQTMSGQEHEFWADVIFSLTAPSSDSINHFHYYILTNNTDPAGGIWDPQRRIGLSKEGCWNTTEERDRKPLYPDGIYKVQVRFASDIVRRPKYSADEWSDWSDSEQEVIVDNTAPKVLDFRVSVVGGKGVMPVKREDHLILYIPFDQPMSTGPTVQVGSSKSGPWTGVQLWGTWSMNDLDNKKAPFQHLPFIRQALLEGRVVMPALTAQTGTKLYFRLSGAKGLGLFTHTVTQEQTKLTLPDDTMVPAVQTDPNLKCREPLSNDPDNLPICVEGDLVPPKLALQQTKNKVTLTCSDQESGLAYCSLLVPNSSPSLCAQEQDVSKLFPQTCVSQTYPVQGWVKDCAGNRAKEGLTQDKDPDLDTKITVPPLSCEPQDRSDVCWKRTEQLACDDGLNRCVVRSVDVQRRGTYAPGCDQPDENIDLSSHGLRYDQLTNVDPTARVGVLESAYAPQTIYLLATFGEKAAVVARSFTPALVQTQPVLVLPSGSLAGHGNNSAFKAALAGYVSQGGRLLVLAQAWGNEWSLLPGKLAGKGWNEDISCFWRTTKMEQYHAGLAVMQEQLFSAPFDNYFTNLPKQAIARRG